MGAVVLLGVKKGDTEDARRLSQRCADLAFADERGNLNRSIAEARGSFLVAATTLYADTKGGRQPSFTEAAQGRKRSPCISSSAASWAAWLHGGARRRGAMMDVELVNQGPVTLLLDQP